MCVTDLPTKITQSKIFLDVDHWRKEGKDEINEAVNTFKNLNTNQAKNIILFIGDGMSLETLTASRIFKAQQNTSQTPKCVGKDICYGEETLLFMETLSHVGLSKVQNQCYQLYLP